MAFLVTLIAGVIAGDAVAQPQEKFAPGSLKRLLPEGYIDSIFFSKNGRRLYFTYSPFAPRVLNGTISPDMCEVGDGIVGHTRAPGLEWNTDLYYVQWDKTHWSGPYNVGSAVNSLAMDCCVWVNGDEKEMIFYRESDLDSDGESGDLGLPKSGNYRSVRNSPDSEWLEAKPLVGVYGTQGQGRRAYRHDIQKMPSKNMYLWEKTADNTKRLLFARWNGVGYDAPVVIPAAAGENTQLWVSDDELRLVYNHRAADGATELHQLTRQSVAEPWGAFSVIQTQKFEDAKGKVIWGEPTFDATEKFMLFVRFNTENETCWRSEIMYAPKNAEGGFGPAVALN